MLDSDLAILYGVTTGHLNRAVKRNPDRFPPDFMFQLTLEEVHFFEMPIWHFKAESRRPSTAAIRFHRTRRRDAFERAAQRTIRGAHAPRVLAMAASPSRTFSSARILYIPHAFEIPLFGKAPKRTREARVLPRMIAWTIYLTFVGAVLLLFLPRRCARWIALLTTIAGLALGMIVFVGTPIADLAHFTTIVRVQWVPAPSG